MESQNSTHRRPNEHRSDGQEAAADVRIRAAREVRIGGKSRDGLGQHRRCQVGHTKAARGGVLQAHCKREKHDEGVGEASATHIGRRKRHNQRGAENGNLGVGCQREKSATMLARARAEAASSKGPQQKRTHCEQRYGH